MNWKPSRGGWEVQVPAGTDSSGERRRRTKFVRAPNTAAGRKEAEKMRTQLLAEVDAQTVTDSSSTVAQLLEQWFAVKSRTRWSPTTSANYRRIIDRRLVPRWGRVKLRDVRRADLMAWHDELFAAGVSLPTVRRFHAVLRSALGHAVERELLAANPASSKGMLPMERRGDIAPPSPEELERVLVLINDQDPDFGTFVRVASWCGLRRSEMCGLRWGDLDLEDGELAVQRAVVQIGRQLHVKGTKSEKARRMAVGPITVAAFVGHRTRAQAVGTDVGPGRYVWTQSPDGADPWTPDSVTARWSRFRKQAGVSCRLHDLRHYMATQMLDQGESIVTVQTRLGHTKPSTTLDIYSHAIKARDREAAGKIEQMGADVMGRSDLLAWQGRLCWLCDEPYDRTPLVLDHDHVTGLVRGYLCPSCNKAEGYSRTTVVAADGVTVLEVDWEDYRQNPPARRMGLIERYDLAPADRWTWERYDAERLADRQMRAQGDDQDVADFMGSVLPPPPTDDDGEAA